MQVTSSTTGSGKSIIASNLAVAFASAGRQTILVDCDLRRPSVHNIFAVANDNGVAQLLAMADTENEAGSAAGFALPSEVENLWIVPAGRDAHQATEMFAARLTRALALLDRPEALIVVDSPPVLAVSDACAIARSMDAVIMCVDARHEKPERLRSALERLELIRAPLLGVALNRAAGVTDREYFHTS